MYYYLSGSFALALAYAFLMWRYHRDWKGCPEMPSSISAPSSTVALLIAARNEAARMEACLESILQQDYPKALLEIWIVDDYSEDQTANLVRQQMEQHPHLHLLQLEKIGAEGGKKSAMEQAIAHSSGTLIVTTDADCQMGPQWLSSLVALYEQKQARFIAAPVCFQGEKSAFERWQSLDFLGMMGITAAGINGGYLHMCNGANLAYPRRLFELVGGFEGNKQLASGDDMLLLQKIAQRSKAGIYFAKSLTATVYTQAKPNWSSFVEQRVRWASKSSAYEQQGVNLQLALVWLFMLSLLTDALLTLFWDWALGLLLIGKWVLKAVVDWRLLKSCCQFFQRRDLLRDFWPALFWHFWYILHIGLLANIRKSYTWKSRKQQ